MSCTTSAAYESSDDLTLSHVLECLVLKCRHRKIKLGEQYVFKRLLLLLKTKLLGKGCARTCVEKVTALENLLENVCEKVTAPEPR